MVRFPVVTRKTGVIELPAKLGYTVVWLPSDPRPHLRLVDPLNSVISIKETRRHQFPSERVLKTVVCAYSTSLKVCAPYKSLKRSCVCMCLSVCLSLSRNLTQSKSQKD